MEKLVTKKHDKDLDPKDIDLMTGLSRLCVECLINNIDDHSDWGYMDKILVKLVILASLPV